MSLIGAIVMTRTLDSCVTSRAKGNQVAKIVGGFPIVSEAAPGNKVMNVEWPTKLRFSNAAILAGIGVTLTCGIFLPYPIGAAPLLKAALPIAVILSLLPFGGALVGAELARVFSAVNDMAAYLYGLATLQAGERYVSSLIFARSATKAGGATAQAGGVNLERCATSFAGQNDALSSTQLLALRRAIKLPVALLVALGGKLFAAMGTYASIYSHKVIIP